MWKTLDQLKPNLLKIIITCPALTEAQDHYLHIYLKHKNITIILQPKSIKITNKYKIYQQKKKHFLIISTKISPSIIIVLSLSCINGKRQI